MKTKKKINYSRKHSKVHSRIQSKKQLENLPYKLYRYITKSVKHKSIATFSSKLNSKLDNYNNDNNDNNDNGLIEFSFNPRNSNKYMIATGLSNVEEICKYDRITPLIKRYLPLDAEQYIRDNANIKDEYTLRTFLYVNISEDYYNSYMLDKLIIQNPINRNENGNGNDKKPGYFPLSVPDFYPTTISSKFHYIFAVLNQTFTILKDIAIILSKYVKRPNNIKHCFNIVEVVLNLDNQNNITLRKCIVKKNWSNNETDNMIYEWLNDILIAPVFRNEKVLHSGLSTQLLYTTKNTNAIVQNPNYLVKSIKGMRDVSKMSLEDFKNVYTIFITEKEAEREFRISYLQNKLKKYGINPIDVYSSIGMPIKFLWLFNVEYELDLGQIRKHFNTIAFLANSLSSLDNIDNKFNLYNGMKRLFPNEYRDFMMLSFPLTKNYNLAKGDILVAKPLYLLHLLKQNKKFLAAAGIDIIFVNDMKHLNIAKSLLNKYDTVMMSKYLTNPLLFQKRKFHFRLVFIISIINNTVKSYLLDTMRIITAKSQFVLKDFHNPDIHDTHLKSTEKDWYFPDDFTTANMGKEITADIIEKIWIDIREIMRKITIVALDGNKHIRIYDTNKHGFHIFGPDIMLTEDFKPILLECNSNPTFRRLDYTNHYLDKKLFDLIDNKILLPLFGKSDDKPTNLSMKDVEIYSKRL